MNIKDIKILIACEESQTVCKAFRERGFIAYSNDIQECSGGHPEWHFKMDCFKAINQINPLLLIAHPPCTYLSFAGNSWFNVDKYGEKAIERHYKRIEAFEFFYKLWSFDINHICIENPAGYVMNYIKYSQMIHPYYFGDEYTKKTLLWLKNLPLLIHSKDNNLFDSKTHVDKGEMCKSGSIKYWGADILKLSNNERSKLRSKTSPCIAKAMAEQWGNYLINEYNLTL
jgi:hypothetical protein